MSLETYANWLDEHGELPFGMPTWDEGGYEARLVYEAGYGWFVEEYLGDPDDDEDPWRHDHTCSNYEALAILQRWHRERLREQGIRVSDIGGRYYIVVRTPAIPHSRLESVVGQFLVDGQWLGPMEDQPGTATEFDDYDAALLAAAGAVKKGDSDADA